MMITLKNKKLFAISLVISFTALVAIFFAIFAKKAEPAVRSVSRIIPVMGTILEIKLYGDNEIKLNEAATLAAEEIKRIEQIFSIFGDGEAAKINKKAGKNPVSCSDEMWFILQESKKYFETSEGAFDITIKPMMLLWGFYRKRDQFPSENEIRQSLEKIGFNKLIFDEKNKSIFFKNPEMALDFGGIVKGYAVDRAVAKIAEKGIKAGFVNLGGNIKTLSESPPGKNFYNIGIRDPINKEKVYAFAKIAGSAAIATSGNYERYLILENKHITHIIDPATGYPVENMLSVTVLAPDALCADALSTSVFIRGQALAEKLHSENPNLGFLIYRRDYEGKLICEKIGDFWQIQSN